MSRLDAVLDEIDEFLQDQEDVRDGSDGTPLPNRAMSLLTDLRYARSYPVSETPVKPHHCPTCGAFPVDLPTRTVSAAARTCPNCKGSGDVQGMTQHLGPDDYEVTVTCPECKGTGELSAPSSGAVAFDQAIKDAAADVSSFMPRDVEGVMQHGTGKYEQWVEGAIRRAFERHQFVRPAARCTRGNRCERGAKGGSECAVDQCSNRASSAPSASAEKACIGKCPIRCRLPNGCESPAGCLDEGPRCA